MPPNRSPKSTGILLTVSGCLFLAAAIFVGQAALWVASIFLIAAGVFRIVRPRIG